MVTMLEQITFLNQKVETKEKIRVIRDFLFLIFEKEKSRNASFACFNSQTFHFQLSKSVLHF